MGMRCDEEEVSDSSPGENRCTDLLHRGTPGSPAHVNADEGQPPLCGISTGALSSRLELKDQHGDL